MKKVVRLTEKDLTRIVKRVMNEQLAMGGQMIGAASDWGVNLTPHDIGSPTQKCKVKKNSSELVLELFKKLRSLKGQPDSGGSKIQSLIVRLSNSIKGLGMDDTSFKKIINEITTPEEMGSILNGYYKKFGRNFYQDLSGEYTTGWDTIWGMVKKFATDKVKIDYCKVTNTISA